MGETDMKIEKVTGIYFSPTGHTREVVQHIAEGLDNSAELLDLTSAEHETQRRQYSAQELVVVGVPVYGGRIPALAEKRMTLMQGDQTPAVIVVTYGNRDYEDALLELKNELEHRRFVVVGAAAVVTEHSIVHEVGAGRPDEQDWQQINHFVEELNKKLQQLDNVNQQERVKLPTWLNIWLAVLFAAIIVVLILRLAVYKDSILLSSLSSLLLGIACLSLFYIRRFKHTKKESPVYKIITVVLTVCGVIYTFMGAVGLLSLAGIL